MFYGHWQRKKNKYAVKLLPTEGSIGRILAGTRSNFIYYLPVHSSTGGHSPQSASPCFSIHSDRISWCVCFLTPEQQ